MLKSLLPSAAAALALLVAPVAASAHTRLIASTPAAGSTASKVTSVSLHFSEKLIPTTIKTSLVMTAMPGMTDHPPMKIPYSSAMGKDGKSMTLLLKRPLAAGSYTLSWSAAGADTHRMGSEFSFTVK
ncbi:MAG TPA: copper resistance protein CopC [Sphingopyxis sp.]|uniref:copper resistance protein CopC n=1 Tax=Sphingopyxis sp. TaxID=1908224 RepID=UPI002E36B474|nr:copper resistance protein CopC [Sphingopyxis sp.]HEX2813999.1 copper resistance protein CopC [Sphingopyxis sp.]